MGDPSLPRRGVLARLLSALAVVFVLPKGASAMETGEEPDAAPIFATNGRVKAVEARVEALEKHNTELATQLAEIDALVSESYRKLMRTGDLYTAVADAKTNLETIRALLQRCETATGSPNDIAAVRESLVAMGKMLNRP